MSIADENDLGIPDFLQRDPVAAVVDKIEAEEENTEFTDEAQIDLEDAIAEANGEDPPKRGRKPKAEAENARARPGNNSGVDADKLRSYIERIERLEDEKSSLGEDIKDVYTEAKSNGFDAKTMRKVVALRKKDQTKVKEEEALLDIYMWSLGMTGDA